MIIFRQKIYDGLEKPEVIAAPVKAIKPMPTQGIAPPAPAPYLGGDPINHAEHAQALANQRATQRLTEKAQAKLSTMDEKAKLIGDKQMQAIKMKQIRQQQKVMMGQKSAFYM